MNPPEQPEGERWLAAIMFTDMVAFTALTQRNEALAMDLLEEQRRLVRSCVATHHGREVKTIGDAFLVEFASAFEAVECAIAVQEALRERNRECPDERRIWLRIGIHLGDVFHDGTDVAGDAVNVASRIERLAPPGGVCVTAQVHASVLNKVGHGFESLGTPELKNVAAPIEVFRLAGLGSATIAQAAPARSAPPRDRVAVLPFANISPDQADDYFADGMTEELISSVSRINGLRIIARTSVMRYKGASKPISEIGRELNVGSVLEGSVRKAGDKVRISVQLIDTVSEEPRWSHRYDRSISDIFAIQSEIAQNVAEALRDQVLGSAPAGEVSRATGNTEAYIAYLRGRQFWNRRSQDDLTRAIGFFEEALGLDPNYARAYTGLSDSYATLALLEFVAPHEAYPKAREAVSRALSLDPRLAEAHTSLGLIRFQYEWDWRGAEESLTEAIQINATTPQRTTFSPTI